MKKVYKNAPLVEAIYEIRFPAKLEIESKRDKFYNRIKNEFPKIYLPLLKGGEAPSLQPYRFTKEDESGHVFFSLNIFYFTTKKYISFKEFKKEALSLTKDFCSFFKVQELNRSGLRYINKIPIIRKKGIIELNKYLNFGFNLPKSIPSSYKNFKAEFITELRFGNLRVLAEYQELEEPSKDEIIILDFDYFIEGKLDSVKLEKYIDESHKHTKQAFEALIADPYKKVMGG